MTPGARVEIVRGLFGERRFGHVIRRADPPWAPCWWFVQWEGIAKSHNAPAPWEFVEPTADGAVPFVSLEGEADLCAVDATVKT